MLLRPVRPYSYMARLPFQPLGLCPEEPVSLPCHGRDVTNLNQNCTEF